MYRTRIYYCMKENGLSYNIALCSTGVHYREAIILIHSHVYTCIYLYLYICMYVYIHVYLEHDTIKGHGISSLLHRAKLKVTQERTFTNTHTHTVSDIHCRCICCYNYDNHVLIAIQGIVYAISRACLYGSTFHK